MIGRRKKRLLQYSQAVAAAAAALGNVAAGWVWSAICGRKVIINRRQAG